MQCYTLLDPQEESGLLNISQVFRKTWRCHPTISAIIVLIASLLQIILIVIPTCIKVQLCCLHQNSNMHVRHGHNVGECRRGADRLLCHTSSHLKKFTFSQYPPISQEITESHFGQRTFLKGLFLTCFMLCGNDKSKPSCGKPNKIFKVTKLVNYFSYES